MIVFQNLTHSNKKLFYYASTSNDIFSIHFGSLHLHYNMEKNISNIMTFKSNLISKTEYVFELQMPVLDFKGNFTIFVSLNILCKNCEWLKIRESIFVSNFNACYLSWMKRIIQSNWNCTRILWLYIGLI